MIRLNGEKMRQKLENLLESNGQDKGRYLNGKNGNGNNGNRKE